MTRGENVQAARLSPQAPQIRWVVVQQANQIKPSLEPSSMSHAAEEHTRRTKLFELGIYCLLQNAVDRELGEVDRSLGGDPSRESSLTVSLNDQAKLSPQNVPALVAADHVAVRPCLAASMRATRTCTLPSPPTMSERSAAMEARSLLY